MEIIINTIRNIFFAAVVLLINIPLFWSFQGFIDFIKQVLITIGLAE